MGKKISVMFWGVRGSMPQCGPDYIQVGGHTSCVGVHYTDTLFCFDGGTGVTNASKYYKNNKDKIKTVHLFLSHVHLDHISGIPFFTELWNLNSNLDLYIYCATTKPFGGLQKCIETFISPPYFPISIKDSKVNISYIDLDFSAQQNLNNAPLQTIPLCHPGGSTGYRLNIEGKSFVYLTDSGPLKGEDYKNLIHFCKQADLAIIDTTFTDEELGRYPTWGHGTPAYAAKLAHDASIKEIALFHHGPHHSDTYLLEHLVQAQKLFLNSFLAAEGLIKTYEVAHE